MSNRSIVYIDGFNFYYGVLKDSPDKWLDIQAYFTKLRQTDDVQKIWYFTALVGGDQRLRQKTYLDALTTLHLVDVQFGHYKQKTIKCNVRKCTFSGPREFRAPEEKGTDVKIALQMLDDAYQNACDRIILVSGDSDLVPAIELIKTRFPEKRITVYVPARDPTRAAARSLRGAAHKHKTLPVNLLKKCQFPDSLVDVGRVRITKPSAW